MPMHPDPRTRALTLADAWERLCGTPLWHAAGCRCAGGAGCLLIHPASMQIDLLESLASQARLNDDPKAAALVLQRLEPARQGADLPPFGDWVRHLPDSGLPPASMDRFLSSVERFVDSLQAPPAPRLTYTYLGDIS